MALSAHQAFFSSLVRLCTCPRSCLKWACLDSEFLSLSQAAWAERFASINVRISWSFWSNQSWCLRLQKPRAVSAVENTASLNTVQACFTVSVSTGRAGSSSHNFSCSSLWMPVWVNQICMYYHEFDQFWPIPSCNYHSNNGSHFEIIKFARIWLMDGR